MVAAITVRQRSLFRPGRRGQQAARVCAAVLLTIVLAWSAGLVWLIRHASMTAAPPPHADGMVVLTGGADRVETALRLLAKGSADRLLVSGIGGGANFKDLAHQAEINPMPLARQVTLGRGAATTHGNAAETAAWARRMGLTSLIVVTAAYHMPRALVEIGRALPGVKLYPAPVLPTGILHANGWPTRLGLRLLVEEWNKFLAAELGLTSLEAVPLPRLSAASSVSDQAG
jgi:uncharacterized SAM-binding protein YcdF (DUF218 family)